VVAAGAISDQLIPIGSEQDWRAQFTRPGRGRDLWLTSVRSSLAGAEASYGDPEARKSLRWSISVTRDRRSAHKTLPPQTREPTPKVTVFVPVRPRTGYLAGERRGQETVLHKKR
jgi:hypothetical protein